MSEVTAMLPLEGKSVSAMVNDPSAPVLALNSGTESGVWLTHQSKYSVLNQHRGCEGHPQQSPSQSIVTDSHEQQEAAGIVTTGAGTGLGSWHLPSVAVSSRITGAAINFRIASH